MSVDGAEIYHQLRKITPTGLIGKRMMTRVGRAHERSETDGFIEILVDADSEQILAAILGIGGNEVVHTLLTAMYSKLPYTVVSRAVHIHPTVAELPHRPAGSGTLGYMKNRLLPTTPVM